MIIEYLFIGFSWNSKTDYPLAQNNAKDNGLKLAQFIVISIRDIQILIFVLYLIH